ncbi:MAG: DUF3108 domain-containing protein [Nitrobacter sp.]
MPTSVPTAAGASLALFAAILALAGPAAAQGRLEAHYDVTLAGILIGTGAWTIEVLDDQYSAAANGSTTGLLKTFAHGTGTGTSQGRVINGALVPANYTATISSSKKSETIHMSLAGGNVKDFVIEPTPPIDAKRIPVTDAHKRGVFDPMSATLLRVPGNADPLGPEACHATTGIFDGRMRYDLRLDFKRIDTVKSEKGYHGPAVVCSIYFSPISGYVPDRYAIKYLASQRNMEVWLAPIAGTRVLAPYRLTIPTPLGTGKLEATQFITKAVPPRTAAKTQ